MKRIVTYFSALLALTKKTLRMMIGLTLLSIEIIDEAALVQLS